MTMESLKVNRDLLDPNFDGYKLSLDSLPIYNINVAGVDSVKLREDEYTLQHVKAFGITNHLILDQWNPNNVLYVDNTGSVMKMRVVLETDLNFPQEVFTIPNFRDLRGHHRHNITMHFPSKDLCVLSDGAGTLYVLKTGDRDKDDSDTWKVVFKEQVCREGKPFIIQHSTANSKDASQTVHCLVLHIDEREERENKEGEGKEEDKMEQDDGASQAKTASVHKVMLEWFSITQESDSAEFKLSRSRQFKSKTVPTYSAIDETGRFVYIASPSQFELIHDSGKEVTKKVDKADDDKPKEKTLYTWTQTEEDLTITFILPDTVSRQEIHFKVTSDRVELGIHEKVMLLEGAMHRAIDPALCTWTFNNRKFEVMLAKQEEGPMWTDLVIGDHRGQYLVDPDQARRIHEKLAHLTTDDLNVDSTMISGNAGINSQDLEECDTCTEENTTLVRFDGDNHSITNQVNIGIYQCLFTAQLDPTKPPCLCLRHDVDGLIWQPQQPTQDTPQPWQHIKTFNALGYVQASKQERKFTSCPPSASYAVLCDCARRLYIYRQPLPTENVLKNRKSGQIVGAVAKQQLISLDTTEDILGMQATEERIFVLTTSKLYIIRVSL